VRVTLTAYEMSLGWYLAGQRSIRSLMRGSRDNHGLADPVRAQAIHIYGVWGEMAVAKALGVYFEPTVDTFKVADVGQDVQVRWAEKDEHRLILREADDPAHAYVLVTGYGPTFEVRGWMDGATAKRDTYRTELGNGRPPVYAIAAGALYPVEALAKQLERAKQERDYERRSAAQFLKEIA
jgi:hypothetical protein